ncbi:MAG: thioredoxin domain-containing protein [Muribaculaceae bacterium]|nr:thioredoxin domain-containing protein [Muribaculaceae bacterium]
MKKSLIISLLMGGCALTGFSQTEFRHISFDEGLKAAANENKLVFIDFYTDWCGPCRKMANEVFPQKNVGDYMNKNYVCLKINAEQGESVELMKKYKVNAFPTMVVLDSKGGEVGRLMGYREGNDFLTKLQSSVDPEKSPERMKERIDGGERTPDLVNNYALYLIEQKKNQEALDLVTSYFNSIDDKQRLAPENNFLFTRYTTNTDCDMGRFMVANRNKFDKSQQKAVNDRIADLYHRNLGQYFSGYIFSEGKFDSETFQRLKKEMTDLGLTKNYKYDVMFDFIEKRASTKDDAEYLAFCDKRYNDLETSEKNSLVFNLTRLVNSNSKEMKQSISKFIRSRLHEMSPVAIQYSGRILTNMEQ